MTRAADITVKWLAAGLKPDLLAAGFTVERLQAAGKRSRTASSVSLLSMHPSGTPMENSTMDKLKALKYFVASVEGGSFARAAQRLEISAPAVQIWCSSILHLP
ncbi:LysR family transcriptional regulator [Roseateles sp.]|uniref:helix-turn-helix domain-containing protein n=1 Tax=Roseateles sp. TaxID=1971397 RepID=UPI003264CE50